MTNKEDRDIEVAALKFLDSIASPSAKFQNDMSPWGAKRDRVHYA